MNKLQFENYNANPHNKKAQDCTIRAISTALGETWGETYKGLFEIGFKKGRMPNEKNTFKEYLKKKGYDMEKQPRKANGKKYTIKEFFEQEAETNKTYIILVRHHLTCIKKGTLIDTWNCSSYIMRNYWKV